MTGGQASTPLEALTAELLGDVGKLYDRIKELGELFPDLLREISDTTKQAVAATLKDMPSAGLVHGVAGHMMLVRDHMEKLIAQMEALPQEAVAQAVAPAVRATIEGVQEALGKLREEAEQAAGRADTGIEDLTRVSMAAIAGSKSAADKVMGQLAEGQAGLTRLLTDLRAASETLSKNTASGLASIERASATATQQSETARASHRLTAIVAVVGIVALLWLSYRGEHSGGYLPVQDAALARWATSEAGRDAYAFDQANAQQGIALLEACDIPGWRRATVRHRPACVAAIDGHKTYGWFLPEKR